MYVDANVPLYTAPVHGHTALIRHYVSQPSHLPYLLANMFSSFGQDIILGTRKTSDNIESFSLS